MIHWRYTVERSKTPLLKWRWVYAAGVDFSGATLVLDSYSVLSRETTRHKFREGKHWERIRHRRSTMERKDVPEDGGVRAEVRQAYIESITFECVESE